MSLGTLAIQANHVIIHVNNAGYEQYEASFIRTGLVDQMYRFLCLLFLYFYSLLFFCFSTSLFFLLLFLFLYSSLTFLSKRMKEQTKSSDSISEQHKTESSLILFLVLCILLLGTSNMHDAILITIN